MVEKSKKKSDPKEPKRSKEAEVRRRIESIKDKMRWDKEWEQ